MVLQHLRCQLTDSLVQGVVLSKMLALVSFKSLLQVGDLDPADLSVLISLALLLVDLTDSAFNLLESLLKLVIEV